MTELKPCPFCGGEAVVTFESDVMCSVECTECYAAIDGVEAWNTRAVDDENTKLRELVRDLYMQLLNAYDPKELDGFEDRIRWLGIEVDG